MYLKMHCLKTSPLTNTKSEPQSVLFPSKSIPYTFTSDLKNDHIHKTNMCLFFCLCWPYCTHLLDKKRSILSLLCCVYFNTVYCGPHGRYNWTHVYWLLLRTSGRWHNGWRRRWLPGTSCSHRDVPYRQRQRQHENKCPQILWATSSGRLDVYHYEQINPSTKSVN